MSRGFSPKEGLISTVNSSVATLLGGIAFTGVGEDVSDYNSISVTWNSDVASAKLGMRMEFSHDNVNWDRSIPVSSHSDILQLNHGGVHRLSVIAQYFRVVYTNGVDAQSFFRLQVLYHGTNSLPLISRIEQQLNTSSDVNLVRQVTNIDLDLARQYITGQRAFFFFGFNDTVGTSWEDIWSGGGDINWLTTAGTVEVLSSNAADTAAGLGVRSVEIHGLSATGEDQTEIIAMNGVTPVVSALSYIRMHRVHSEECGTYGGSHQGDITCRVTGGGAVLAVMTGREGAVDSSVQYGSGESGNGFYSVPLGKVAYITRLEVIPDVGSNKTIDIALYERENILVTSAPVGPRRVLWGESAVEEIHTKVFKSHIKIKALTDIWFRAQGSATSAVEVYLDFYLLDENAAGA